MFVSSFVRSKFRDPEYKKFVETYYKFRGQDVVYICDRHHTEIHVIYDHIIQKDLALRGKKLQLYTWGEARKLMDKLEKRCMNWMKLDTPGAKVSKKRRTKGGYQAAVKDLKKQWIKG